MSKFKPAWTKEPKAMGLRPATKPGKSSYVSGVVVFSGKHGETGIAYIRFSEKLEEMLGAKMPIGVSPQDPAFLKVIWNGWTYEVRGCYVYDRREVLLWNTNEIPIWCKPRLAKRGKDHEFSGRQHRSTERTNARLGKRQGHPLHDTRVHS